MEREVKDGLVNLKVGEYIFECDRKVLASNSPYFHAMFSSNFAEKSQSEIQLNDIDFTCLATILLAVKGEGIDWSVSEDDLISTLATAHMLQFDAVEEQIIHYIAHSWLSIDNCLKVMMIADKLSLTKLYKKAKLLAVNNVKLVIKSRSFLELPLKELIEFLSNESLNIDDERIVCEGVINWIKDDYNARFIHVKDLLIVIRFSQLSTKVISEYLLASVLKKIPFAVSLLQCVAFKMSQNYDPVIWTHNFSESFRACAVECLALPRRKGSVVPCIVGGILKNGSINDKSNATDAILKNGNSNDKPNATDPKDRLYDNYLFYWIDDDLRPVIPLNSVMTSNLEGARIVRKDMYLYLVGGEYKIGSGVWNNEIRRYNIGSELWEEITRLPKPRRHQGTCIIDDELFIIGGMSKYRVQVDLVDIFNLQTGLWSQCPALPSNCNSSVPWCVHKKNIFLFCADYSIQCLPPPRAVWHCLKRKLNFLTIAAVSDGCYIYLIGSVPPREKMFLYRLNPDSVDEEIHCVGQLASRGTTSACVVNNIIYCFTKSETTVNQSTVNSTEAGDYLFVETYNTLTGKFTSPRLTQLSKLTFFPSVGCFNMPHIS